MPEQNVPKSWHGGFPEQDQQPQTYTCVTNHSGAAPSPAAVCGQHAHLQDPRQPPVQPSTPSARHPQQPSNAPTQVRKHLFIKRGSGGITL